MQEPTESEAYSCRQDRQRSVKARAQRLRVKKKVLALKTLWELLAPEDYNCTTDLQVLNAAIQEIQMLRNKLKLQNADTPPRTSDTAAATPSELKEVQ